MYSIDVHVADLRLTIYYRLSCSANGAIKALFTCKAPFINIKKNKQFTIYSFLFSEKKQKYQQPVKSISLKCNLTQSIKQVTLKT